MTHKGRHGRRRSPLGSGPQRGFGNKVRGNPRTMAEVEEEQAAEKASEVEKKHSENESKKPVNASWFGRTFLGKN